MVPRFVAVPPWLGFSRTTREVAMGSTPDVQIRMPAVSANIGLTRLVAAALGSQAGLPIEDVDELRMAVDELCYWLIGECANVTAREFEVTFTVTAGCVHARGSTVGSGWDETTGLDAELSPLSRRILDALADEYDCTWAVDVRRFSLLKLSRA
jgi:hypothetical protein